MRRSGIARRWSGPWRARRVGELRRRILSCMRTLEILRRRVEITGSLGLLLLVGCVSQEAKTKAVEQRLTTGVPLQSTPTQVLSYLESQRIEHSPYQRDAMKGNSIKAAIREKSGWNVVRTDYGIVFTFDDHDHLTHVDVQPWYTGP